MKKDPFTPSLAAFFAIATMCLAMVAPLSADIYKCTDETGRVKFSNTPCGSNEKSELIQEEKAQGDSFSDDSPESSSSTLAGDSEQKALRVADPTVSGPSTEALPPVTVAPRESVGERYANHPADTSARSASIQDFTESLEQISPLILLAVFLVPPVLAWGLGMLHRKGDGDLGPWRYFYSFLVYLTCVPGIFSSVLTAYSLFFVRQNLLHVNIFVYFLPIISMVATLVVIARNARWKNLPGVDRLTALITLLAISFSVALFVQKTRVWIVFGGRFTTLIAIAFISFVVLKWGLYKLFRKKGF